MLGFLPFWGFLWPSKLTLIGHWMNFNSPILFLWLLKAMFFTRCLYFHHNWWKERGTKINSLIFLKDVTEEKNAEIHKHAKIIWIFKKLNSLKSNYSQTTFKAKLPSEKNLEKIIFNNSNSHCLEQIWVSSPCLSSDLSYRDLTIAAPISFH